METKHTKGKWRIAYENKNAVVSEVDGKILTICTTTNGTGKYMTVQEAEANAKLIAAAPELLEALVMVKEWAEEFGMGEKYYVQITSAIKKATE